MSREAYTEVGNPSRYRLLERWADAAHLGEHLASDEHRALVGGIRALGTLLVEESVYVRDPSLEDPARSLVHLVMHELKNPLADVVAHVELVRDELSRVDGMEAPAQSLRAASAACEHVERFMADVLVLLRIGADHLRVLPSPTDVRGVLHSVARAFTPLAIERNVAIEIAAEPIVARLDPTLVRRLLESLASSAVRRSSRGDRIQLAAWSAGDEIGLAVRSTGPALPGSVVASLEECVGAPPDLRLALYLCRLVAEAHGGRLVHASRPGWSVSLEALLPRDAAAGGVQ